MDTVVDVTGIATGGAGVARLPDGRVTFVHRTAPGDRVRVRVVEERGRWTRSTLVDIVDPAPGRRPAPCPHYARCGGCTLEHLAYPAQLEAKADIVSETLRRIGGVDVDVPEVVPSPQEFRYRNRVSFTLRRTPEGVVAGFHALDEPDEIVDIGAACLLPEAPIAEAWGRLRSAWGPDARRLPSGGQLRLTLRGTAEGEVGLAVDGGYAPGRPEELVAGVDALVAVWHRPEGRRTFRRLAGSETVEDRWAGAALELSGDMFTQVNRGAASMLREHVLDRARDAGAARVVDAYCGVGLYGRALAEEGAEVTGIEAHPGAVEEARRAAPGIQLLEGRVEDHLPQALPADLVILNPPRTGLGQEVSTALASSGTRRAVYVSCDPATLARDLGRLEDAYRVVGIRCFDLFPQTAHVETVVELERCDTM